MRAIEDVRSRLAIMADPGQSWLRCDVCDRFFQYKRAAPSPLGGRDACPFPDCHGMGLGFNLFMWDDMREPEDPRWPRSPEELYHGRRVPEMESFYHARQSAYIDRLVEAFAASPECKALAHGVSHLPGFLHMQLAFEWEIARGEAPLMEPTPSDVGDVADSLRISDARDATQLLAELRAFFGFAQRIAAVPDLEPWIAVLDSPEAEQALVAAAAKVKANTRPGPHASKHRRQGPSRRRAPKHRRQDPGR